jgi:transposase-like protein
MARPRVLLSESKLRNVREAWHGALSCEQIARRHALGEKLVRRIWDDAREAGLLPDGARPHFAAQSKPAEAVDVDDESPVGDPNPTYERNCDAALAALRAQHGADDPALHVMPADWLRLDLDAHFAPTPDMLADWCRARDAGYALDVRNARRGGR